MSHFEIYSDKGKLLGISGDIEKSVNMACSQVRIDRWEWKWHDVEVIESCGHDITVVKKINIHPGWNGSHVVGES